LALQEPTEKLRFQLIFDIFKNLGYQSALISTVEYRIGDEIIPSTHTTPDVIR
jgi:UDP-N-acetylmuramoyl-L-alanyl-D-glutamate--2,6-diaminopimelate ligase